LDPFYKQPPRAALAEGRVGVVASAVWALGFICAATTAVANLTTCGTSLSYPASIFSTTKFMALKTAQWVWYVDENRNSNVTNGGMFWDD